MFAHALTQTFNALFSAPLLPREPGATAVGRFSDLREEGPSAEAPELRSPYELPAHDLDQRVRASGEW